MQSHLDASFALAGHLLEAFDEPSAILATMRTGKDLLSAEGCVFVPFNEWIQSFPVLKYGQIPEQSRDDWPDILSAPATRRACKVCESREAGPECVLLKGASGSGHTYCVALRCGGREIGVISYFFLSAPDIDKFQHRFLAEMVRLTDISLESIRLHERQLDANRRLLPAADLGKVLAQLDSHQEEIIREVEYNAILDERTRLAREIHDGLAQTLAFLKIEAARMQGHLAEGKIDAVTTTLQACHQTLSDAYIDARQAIDNLRTIPGESISDWIQNAADDFQSLTEMTVELSISEFDPAIPPKRTAQLVRIVQEALTNVRKHAKACTVNLSVSEQNGNLVIEIKDNGQGFSPEELHPVSQYGLRTMRERAEAIGANLQITSARGSGTTVQVQLPLLEQVAQ